jgi:hypothetical protein
VRVPGVRRRGHVARPAASAIHGFHPRAPSASRRSGGPPTGASGGRRRLGTGQLVVARRRLELESGRVGRSPGRRELVAVDVVVSSRRPGSLLASALVRARRATDR